MQETAKDKVDYTKRLEDAFSAIMRGYREVVPQYKSLHERLHNIREFANYASRARYLKNAQPEAILANLIMQILSESDETVKDLPRHEQDFFEILAGTKELKLEEALSGFEFFDNNPYRINAEKRLEKIKGKRKRG